MTEHLTCVKCGKPRGELAKYCAPCLSEKLGTDESDRYRMEDTVRDEDRARERSARNSDGRFYHD